MNFITRLERKFYHIATKIDKRFSMRYRYQIYEKIYAEKSKLTSLSIANKREGESDYLNRWKRISNFVSPTAYRYYSQYIGNDSRIVPELVLRKVIEPIFHPVEYVEFYNDKNMYDKLFPKSFLAESVFRCIDGIFTNGNYEVLHDCNDSVLINICKKFEFIIVKPTRNTGHGGKVLLYQLDAWGRYKSIGHQIDFSIKSLVEYYNGNFVIQERLKQSTFTSQFNPSSVNTFRIFTYKSVKTNEVHVLGIVFRMGKKDTFVDNCDAGGTFIGVSHDGHFLNPCTFDHNGKKYSTFNGLDFTKEYVVPYMQDIINFSKIVGERIFHNRNLDLDVMLDEENKPRLIEYNVDACTAWLYQYSTGPVFGDFTDEVVDYIESQLKK